MEIHTMHGSVDCSILVFCMHENPYIKYSAFINNSGCIFTILCVVLFSRKQQMTDTRSIQYAISERKKKNDNPSIHQNRSSYQFIFACFHITREHKRKLIIKLQYAFLSLFWVVYTFRLRLTLYQRLLQTWMSSCWTAQQ